MEERPLSSTGDDRRHECGVSTIRMRWIALNLFIMTGAVIVSYGIGLLANHVWDISV